MALPKRHFIDGEYGQIHLRMAQPEQPKFRPILCLHMFPQSGRNFHELVGVFGETRLAIAPDFPGYGESDPPPQPIDASDYARAMWDVIDAYSLIEKYGSVDLFGIHAGSKLAVEVAHQRPDDVNRIVLASAAVMFPDEVAALKKSFTTIPLDLEGTRFAALWKMMVDNCKEHMSLEMMATGFAEMLRGGEGYEWGHDAVFAYNLAFPDILQALPHAVTLLNPKDDLYHLTPRTMDYLQNAHMIDLPEWNHGFLEKHAEEVCNLVSDFLAGSDLVSA